MYQNQIENWVNDYTEEMLSWTNYRISDIENAKDIVQDTFISALKNIGNFKEKSNPKTWLFSILKNKIADFYRKQYREAKTVDFNVFSSFFTSNGEWKKEKRPKDWSLTPEEHLLDNLEFIEILNFCIENLPQKFNAVIKMKFYEEMNTEKICQELEISTTNIWQIMHRAKLKLRDCIENKWFKN